MSDYVRVQLGALYVKLEDFKLKQKDSFFTLDLEFKFLQYSKSWTILFYMIPYFWLFHQRVQ